jgi:hypothetical protein
MIVTPAETSGESGGWMLRAEYMGGGKAGSPRRLILDRCTLAGGGFLQLAGFSLGNPVQIEVSGCAVQARSLVRWEPGAGGAALDARTVQWQGKGNLLDIRGPSWIEAAGAAAATPGPAVDSLETWSRIVTESGPSSAAFPARPASPGTALRPGDFAIQAAGSRPVGADPAQVGPRPVRLSAPS